MGNTNHGENFDKEWNNLKHKFQHYNELNSIEYFRTISFVLGRKLSVSHSDTIMNVTLFIQDMNPSIIYDPIYNPCTSGTYQLKLKDENSKCEFLICTANNTQSLVDAILLIMPMIKQNPSSIQKILSPIDWKNWLQNASSRKVLVELFGLTLNVSNFTF